MGHLNKEKHHSPKLAKRSIIYLLSTSYAITLFYFNRPNERYEVLNFIKLQKSIKYKSSVVKKKYPKMCIS